MFHIDKFGSVAKATHLGSENVCQIDKSVKFDDMKKAEAKRKYFYQ